MPYILTVDFGSTFTKLTAIDTVERKILGTARAYTTIETDIRNGYNNALKILTDNIGELEFSEKYASSSAGGGLKMVAVGLVPELTAKAARLAANNAGAKVIKTYSYELSKSDQHEILEIKPDIVLLCGGTDGGNKEVIIHNAKQLVDIPCVFSIIVAGNKSAVDVVSEILEGKKHTIVTENVMPRLGELNILPAKNTIRDVFIERIIEAKGIGRAQEMMSDIIVPTPLAVFEAAELLSKHYQNLMVVDVGGATTDVYSMADGSPTKANAVLKGIVEPFAKRSVEGDLGLRYGMPTLVEAATAQRVAKELNIETKDVLDWLEICKAAPDTVPENGSPQKAIDDTLAALAVEIAFNRHCGTIESVYTPFGETFLQSGKDLSEVDYLVGVGGPVINSENPVGVLSRAFYNLTNPMALLPKKPKLLLDKKYIFASMGLLARKDPELALEIMIKEFVMISESL